LKESLCMSDITNTLDELRQVASIRNPYWKRGFRVLLDNLNAQFRAVDDASNTATEQRRGQDRLLSLNARTERNIGGFTRMLEIKNERGTLVADASAIFSKMTGLLQREAVRSMTVVQKSLQHLADNRTRPHWKTALQRMHPDVIYRNHLLPASHNNNILHVGHRGHESLDSPEWFFLAKCDALWNALRRSLHSTCGEVAYAEVERSLSKCVWLDDDEKSVYDMLIDEFVTKRVSAKHEFALAPHSSRRRNIVLSHLIRLRRDDPTFDIRRLDVLSPCTHTKPPRQPTLQVCLENVFRAFGVPEVAHALQQSRRRQSSSAHPYGGGTRRRISSDSTHCTSKRARQHHSS
jgi:hypothetical protein